MGFAQPKRAYLLPVRQQVAFARRPLALSVIGLVFLLACVEASQVALLAASSLCQMQC